MRLEFRLDEAAFSQYLKEIEKEIYSEQQAFNKHEDVEAILARNRVRNFCTTYRYTVILKCKFPKSRLHSESCCIMALLHCSLHIILNSYSSLI
jgi:hypothetical protein